MAVLDLLYDALLGLTALLVSSLLWTYYNSPLKDIPGPFFAKFTNLWRFFDVWGGRAELTQRMLHQKHGSAVRLGPNTVSLSDPRLIKTIYPIRGEYLKSEFYKVNDVKSGQAIFSNIFSTLSNEFHAMQLKPIQKHYTPNGLMDFEPLVDKTISTFTQKIEEKFVNPGKVGQIPRLDFVLDKNPIHRIGPQSFGTVVNKSVQRTMARINGTDQHSTRAQKDFLDRFIEKKKETDWVDDNQIIGWLCINMFAGSDTTGITLRAIIYYVLKNPRVHRNLQQELDAANLSLPVSHKAAQTLTYLGAVIEEATRMHPAVGLPLERIVPTQGLTLSDGRFIKPGTIVGMNPWVVHQDKTVFGQDAESFNPERWLQWPGET
ncbi:MAG: hypothetical protein M1830_008016, partial [Pleopsidium flavum]